MKKTFRVALCLLLVVGFMFTNTINAEEMIETPRFVCIVYSDQNTVLLSWEKVPFAEDYVIYKDGEEYSRTHITNSDYFSEVDIDIEKDTPIFCVEAYDVDGEKIAESIEAKINPAQLLEPGDPLNMKFQLGNKTYWINGGEKGEMDTAPIIKNGRSFLVIRHITEEIGASISWNGDEKMVTITTKDNKTIRLWIGKPTAHVDGYEVQIDEDDEIVPFISEGRTLLPLRFVSDNLGADEVLWNADTKEIELVWENFYKKYLSEVLKTEEEDGNVILSNGHFWLIFVGKDSELEGGKYYRIDLKFIDQSTTRFESQGAEEILIDENKKIMGTVISNKDRKIEIRSKSGEKIPLTYAEFDCTAYGILENSVISAFYDENKQITYWQYIRNEALESDPATEIKVMFSGDIESDRGFIKIQPEQTIEGEKEEKILFMGDNELSDFENGKLYKITYQTNWLGRDIVLKTEELELKRELKLYKSDTSNLEFREEPNAVFDFSVKNESDIDLEVEYFCNVPVEFKGSVKLTAQSELLKKNQAKKIKVVIYPENTPPGEYTLIYGGKSDELIVSEEIKISILKDETDYEITFPEKIIVPSNFSRFEVMCKAKNNSKEDVTFRCISDIDPNITISYLKRNLTIGGKKEVDFPITVELGEHFRKRTGEQKTISVGCEDSFAKKVFVGKVLFDAPIFPQTKVKVTSEEEDWIIDADINWNGLQPGVINLKRVSPLLRGISDEKAENHYDVELPLKIEKNDNAGIETLVLEINSHDNQVSSQAFETVYKSSSIRKITEVLSDPDISIDDREVIIDFDTLEKELKNFEQLDMYMDVFWGDNTTSTESIPYSNRYKNLEFKHKYDEPLSKRANENFYVYVSLYAGSENNKSIFDVKRIDIALD